MADAKGAGRSAEGAVTVHVETGARRQVIDNFGASGAWSMDPIGRAWGDEDKNRLADLLFSREKGIGLSLWRFNIGAGSDRTDRDRAWHPWRAIECFQRGPDSPFEPEAHAGQQWFLRAAKARGVEHTLAFVNSPPVWMTANGHAFCDPEDGSTNLPRGREPDFARFLVTVLRYFEREGLPFDYVSPVNEPCWDWKGGQEGCRYNNEDVKRVALALDAELRRSGLKHPPHVDLVDTGDIRLLLDDADYRAYRRITGPEAVCRAGNEARSARWGKYREGIRDLLGDLEIRRIVDGRISGHSYWSYDAYHDRHALRRQLRANRERYAPGGRYWQTEVCIMEHGRDLGMDTALRVARLIHHDLVDAEASAWHWWLAVSPGDYKDGLIYTDFDHNRPDGRAVLPSKTLWALGNWSRFVRPGARRVEARTDALPAELLASAYADEKAKRLVVVLVNPGDAARRVRLGADAPVGLLTPHVTDVGRDLSPLSPLPGGEFDVPARSVVTLTGELGAGSKAAVPVVASRKVAPARRERAAVRDGVVYEVRCGSGGAFAAGEGGRRNGYGDMPFGADPATGFRWGHESWGESGARRDGPDVWQGVRWEDGNTPGRGLAYRFEVEPGRTYRVEVGIQDPWKAATRSLDVEVNGERILSAVVPGDGRIEKAVPAARAGGDGFLTVAVLRAAGTTGSGDDPVLSYVRVIAS